MTDYGRDISCLDDCDPMMSELANDDINVLKQAIFRRLITNRGGIIDDPLYGYNLTQWISKASTPKELAAMKGEIRAEVMKDERVQFCSVLVEKKSPTVSIAGSRSGNIVGADVTINVRSSAGPFTLTLAVGDVTVELLKDGIP